MEARSGGVVIAKMRLPYWYGLATEGGDGEAICWWVSCNRWVMASTYSEGSLTAGEACAFCCTSGGRVGSHPVATMDAENP